MAGPEAAGGAKPSKGPSPGHHSPNQVLHQRQKLPLCPAKMAMGGFAFALTIGYFVLYSKKKPEASAVDVAKVATGLSTPEDTHHRK